MACLNCGKRIRRGEFFKLWFFFQSVGQKPRVRSRAAAADVCSKCTAGLRNGERPGAGFGKRFAALLARTVQEARPRVIARYHGAGDEPTEAVDG